MHLFEFDEMLKISLDVIIHLKNYAGITEDVYLKL